MINSKAIYMQLPLFKKILFAILVLRPIIDLFWEFSIGFLNPASILGFLLFLVTIFLISGRIKKIPCSLLFLIICITCSNLLFNSYLLSWSSYFRFLSPLIFLIYFWEDSYDLKLIESFMKLFILVSLIPIIIAFLQYLGLIPYTYWDSLQSLGIVGRASGGYHHPTSLNRILIFTILFSLYFIHTGSMKSAFKYFIYISIACVAVYMTYHRATYFIVPLIFLFWYGNTFKSMKNKIPALIVFTSLFLPLIIIILNSSSVKITDVVNTSTIGNFHGRNLKFYKIFYLFKDSSFINIFMGNGSDVFTKGTFIRFLDNDFLNFLWRYGTLGIFFWFIFVSTLFRSTYLLKQLHTDKDYLFNKMTRIIFICYILFGMIVEVSFLPNFMYIVLSFYVVNLRNIRSNCRNNELEEYDKNLSMVIIMGCAIFCCLILYIVLSSNYPTLQYKDI